MNAFNTSLRCEELVCFESCMWSHVAEQVGWNSDSRREVYNSVLLVVRNCCGEIYNKLKDAMHNKK